MNAQPAPSALTCQVSFLALDNDRDVSLDAAFAVLSEMEIARARRFKFDHLTDRYIRGRGGLRLALGAALGADPHDLQIEEGPYGKPYIPGNPVHFNLSHSTDMAALALNLDAPIGIDIEYNTRARDTDGLAPRVFTPRECQALSQLDDAARTTRFFSYWTAKEARMKLTGQGMHLAPQDIHLTLTDGRATGYDAPAQPPAQLIFFSTPSPALTCAVALGEEE